jgi:cyclic pyranopterin phosphate synthase
MSPAARRAIRTTRVAKGSVLEVARLAGIMAAKKTAEIIPLCHQIPLTHVDVEFHAQRDGYRIVSRTSTVGRTGVEMEALVAASAAALTIYDMVKAIDRTMSIGPIYLQEKRGGKSGVFRRNRR